MNEELSPMVAEPIEQAPAEIPVQPEPAPAPVHDDPLFQPAFKVKQYREPTHIPSLVLGILSIVLGLLIALVGDILGIIGISLAAKNRWEYNVTPGLVCSIIGLVLSIVNHILAIILQLA